MKQLFALLILLSTGLGISLPQEVHGEPAPFADIHIHYNWDQAEVISEEAVIKKLKAAGVKLAVISSTPTDLAQKLQQKAGDWVIPLFSPYIHELGKRDWHLNINVLKKARRELAKGIYRGIGEIHFMAGFNPNVNNAIFSQLMELATIYQLPALIHVDAANEKFFMDICTKHKKVRILLAHAGGNLEAKHIETILRFCPNVSVEFSARDPWRYGGLTDKQGHLLPQWRNLVLNFPLRIMTGTDPVWRVTRTQSWDQPDDGWDHFEKLLQYHQTWINDLPEKVQHRVRWKNAVQFFGYQEGGNVEGE